MNSDPITMYRLVVKDTSAGNKKTVVGSDPIRGRYPAEEILEKVRRANRDPRMVYELEKAPEHSQGTEESGILEHHFRDRH